MLNILLSVFLIPLTIIFNSYFLGKLIRRYAFGVNPYMTTVIGFLIYISILFVFFSLLYTSTTTILVYLIFFVTIQALLLTIYIWNFRYIFLTIHLQFKSFILFISLLLLTIGILTTFTIFVYHTQPISSPMHNLMATFHEHFKSYQASVKFYDEIFTFENFSIFSVFACIFRPLFNINDQYLADYLFLQQIITFGCIFSCAMVGFFYQKVNSANKTLIWFILLISLIIFTFSFMFYESPTIGYSWMSIPIILYCYQTFQYGHRDDRLSNNILLTIVMCFTALDVDLTLITILLLLFNFCYLSIKNHNPIGQSLYCAFPFLYVFFLWMPLFSAVPYAVLLTICLISALIMVLLYSQYIFRKIIMNINKLAYRHPIFIICFISVVIYTLSFFFFVTIFNYHFSWRLWPENYSYIFGINLQKYPNFNLYFNVGSWIVLGGILTAIITYAVTKKNHLSSQPYLFLMLLMILLFINPLTLNLFSKITENNHFKLLDLGLINFLLIFPSILWFGETISGKPMFMLKRKSYEACTN